MNQEELAAYDRAIAKMKNKGIDAYYQSLIIAHLQLEIESWELKRRDSIKIVYSAVDIITYVCNWYHKCDDCPFLQNNHHCGLKAVFGSCTPNNWSTDIRNEFGSFKW